VFQRSVFFRVQRVDIVENFFVDRDIHGLVQYGNDRGAILEDRLTFL
jgi:hypothetical protein